MFCQIGIVAGEIFRVTCLLQTQLFLDNFGYTVLCLFFFFCHALMHTKMFSNVSSLRNSIHCTSKAGMWPSTGRVY